MGYIGKKPTSVPLTSADLADNIVTSAKILNDTIVDEDVNNVAATKLTGTIADARFPATLPAASGANLTSLPAGNLTGTVADARISTLTSSKLTGALPAIDGASLTGVSAGTDWQSVVTGATLTAVAGNGYPINTTSNACTVTLPAGSVGDAIEFVDYAGTWDTNAVTLTADGSEKIKGSTDDQAMSAERQGTKITYIDATQGWVATTASNESATAIALPPYSSHVLVIGGGGSGGFTDTGFSGGGGGSGGISYHNAYTMSPGTTYAVVVGEGGPVVPDDATMDGGPGGTYADSIAPAGEDSVFGSGDQTILTGFGGGGGCGNNGHYWIGGSGGSGGGCEGNYVASPALAGAATQGTGGTTHYGQAGGTPGSGSSNYSARGGGGTDTVTGDRGANSNGGPGTSVFSAWGLATTTGHNVGGTVYYASGGNGGTAAGSQYSTVPNGGGGIGGNSSGSSGGNAIGHGSGGGGRGKWNAGSGDGGSGSDGIVIVRRLTADSATTSGTVSTSGVYTYHVFTADGTYTA